MALLFMDSFDHYVTADFLEKYAALAGGPVLTAAAGRRSSAALVCQYGAYVTTRALAPASPTCLIGVAYKMMVMPGGTATPVLEIRSGGATQLTIALNPAGFLEARRGLYYGTLLGTTSVSISAGSFVCVEVQVLLHLSAGTVTIRFNGVEVLAVTGVNTCNSGTAGWDSVKLLNEASGAAHYDDLYIADGSGPAPWNGFLGDVRVDARYPTAEGASAQWTPSAGTDNALMVDETAPDDDTTYTATSTVGHTDTHVVQDAPVAGATVYGVQLNLSVKKMDAGACTIAPVVRHSGTNYPGAAVAPGTGYGYQLAVYPTNPGTSAAWTEAGFNAAEFGYTRTA